MKLKPTNDELYKLKCLIQSVDMNNVHVALILMTETFGMTIDKMINIFTEADVVTNGIGIKHISPYSLFAYGKSINSNKSRKDVLHKYINRAWWIINEFQNNNWDKVCKYIEIGK